MLTRRDALLTGAAAALAGRTGVSRAATSGPFTADWQSLAAGYRHPDWFRDAKFGIWSHWGPQSVPRAGDWYARNMYIEGTHQYEHHLKQYGHPSQFGYKDIIPLWKAERFDPDALMALYVKAGAKILPYSIVGRQTHVDEGAHIDGAIIWPNGWIGREATVRGAILGRNCHIGRNAVVDSPAVLGDKTVITDYSRL